MLEYSALKILYIGPLNYGGTCLNRMKALICLGVGVDFVNTDLTQKHYFLLDLAIRLITKYFNALWINWVNYKITINVCTKKNYDYLWIDKGLLVKRQTLEFAKKEIPGLKIISYSPDDMLNPGNQSPEYLESLSIYSLNVTTKSYNVDELIELGARNVIFVNNSYSPFVHKQWDREKIRDISVGFIGTYEQQRANSLNFLASNGVKIVVHGSGWNKLMHPNISVFQKNLLDDNYAKTISFTDINLCFLRKVNRDLQTTRSIEIPACGGFMIAERTNEHLELFREGVEAEFFGDDEELLAKIRFYTGNESERMKIARAGLQRCIDSGYSDLDTVQRILDAAKILRCE